MIRPGPESIEPHRAPGGLVFHVYSLDGERIIDRVLTDLDTVVAAALLDGDFVTTVTGGGVIVVIYDGDTGHRWGLHDWDSFLNPGRDN